VRKHPQVAPFGEDAPADEDAPAGDEDAPATDRLFDALELVSLWEQDKARARAAVAAIGVQLTSLGLRFGAWRGGEVAVHAPGEEAVEEAPGEADQRHTAQPQAVEGEADMEAGTDVRVAPLPGAGADASGYAGADGRSDPATAAAAPASAPAAAPLGFTAWVQSSAKAAHMIWTSLLGMFRRRASASAPADDSSVAGEDSQQAIGGSAFGAPPRVRPRPPQDAEGATQDETAEPTRAADAPGDAATTQAAEASVAAPAVAPAPAPLPKRSFGMSWGPLGRRRKLQPPTDDVSGSASHDVPSTAAPSRKSTPFAFLTSRRAQQAEPDPSLGDAHDPGPSSDDPALGDGGLNLSEAAAPTAQFDGGVVGVAAGGWNFDNPPSELVTASQDAQ